MIATRSHLFPNTYLNMRKWPLDNIPLQERDKAVYGQLHTMVEVVQHQKPMEEKYTL